MTNQALDNNEVVTIRWANEDPNPRVAEVEEKEERRMLFGALDKKESKNKEKIKGKISKKKEKRLWPP